jgi:hypothetical protein
VRAFLADEPSDFPVLLDPFQTLSRLFDVGELPSLVVLRSDGTLAAVSRGLTKREDVQQLLTVATAPPAPAPPS